MHEPDEAREVKLRPHQVKGKEALRQAIRDGHKRIVLAMPTGAGKTVSSVDLMLEAAKKNSRSVFIVDRITLIDQTSAVLDSYGLNHGVIQAGHPRWRPDQLIQVCSAQTLERREKILEDLNPRIVFYDECHVVRKAITKWLTDHPNVTTIGLTATPFTRGLANIYSAVASPITHNELVSQGFLSPVKYFAATPIDMADAKIVAGEWSADDITKRGTAILGDIVSEWAKICEKQYGGPVKTLVFSAGVAHGAEICKAFGAAGHNFQQLSYQDKNDAERREKVDEFRKPNSAIIGLVSTDVLTKGFDVPDVLVGISARPFRKSFSSHIQQIGRVMRASPGKDFACWIDHSGNVMRFWEDQNFLFEEGVQTLDSKRLLDKVHAEPTEKEKDQILCRQCKALMPVTSQYCPACGWERPRRSNVIQGAGVILELDGGSTLSGKKMPDWMQDKDTVWRQLAGYAILNQKWENDPVKRQRFCQAKMFAWYGSPYRSHVDKTTVSPPSVELLNRIKYENIKFAKGRSSRRRR